MLENSRIEGVDLDRESVRSSFLNNRNYRKMTSAEEKTAQRDLRDLVSRKLLLKSGQLKGTRYRINIPSKA